ncbi:hypothetical protein [Dongia sp.]|uniref:hypothetical protein n=1 Tax=Dongia sp. TaxID=1977262 RepID=UPI00375069C7
MQNQGPPDALFWVMIVIMIPIYAVTIWAMVRIIQKAGYSGWNFLWYLVPIVNIVMFFIFAFGEWPVTRRIKELEGRVFGDLPDPRLNRPL